MKYVVILLVTLLVVALAAGLVSTCNSEYKYRPHKNDKKDTAEHIPTPAEIARQAEIEDSLAAIAKVKAKAEMANVIKGFSSNHKNNNHTGYFMTDLDQDEFPELWIVLGSLGENFRLELYYPELDGSLRRSYHYTGFGAYYRGDDYLMQAAKSGPDYIDINKITIRKGEIYSDTHHSIDLASDPGAKLPNFKEREVQLTPFTNLSPLNNAFN